MRKGGIHPRPFLQNGRGTLQQLIDDCRAAEREDRGSTVGRKKAAQADEGEGAQHRGCHRAVGEIAGIKILQHFPAPLRHSYIIVIEIFPEAADRFLKDRFHNRYSPRYLRK